MAMKEAHEMSPAELDSLKHDVLNMLRETYPGKAFVVGVIGKKSSAWASTIEDAVRIVDVMRDAAADIESQLED